MEKTLANLDSYQAEYYRRLEALPYFTQIAPVIERFLAAIVERGEFYTRVQTPVLADILEAGSIKSMAETNSGTTLGGIATRKAVTASLFGCDTAALSVADYPKYGFLSQADARRDLLINAAMAMQYGDVSIRLRKNMRTQLGYRLVTNPKPLHSYDSTQWQAHASVAWNHELLSDNGRTSYQLADFPGATIEDDVETYGRDSMSIAAGVIFKTPKRLEIGRAHV